MIRAAVGAALCLASATASIGCHTDMYEQPKVRPLEPSALFADGSSSRPLPPGVVPRGRPEDDTLATGLVDGEPARRFPFPVTDAVMARGRERFDIFCSPCHGRLGDGRGMVVERGFKRPPTFHQARLRDAGPGHFVDVIARGFGAMYPYGDRVPPRDRWAIAAYIRALQRSQNAAPADVPPGELAKLREGER